MFSEWSKEYPHLDAGQPSKNALLVKFRDGAEPTKRPTDPGAPEYDRVIQMEIMAIGQRTSAPIYEIYRRYPDKTVKEDVALVKRFRKVYEAFREGMEPAQDGMPLEQWALMGDRTIVRTFKDCNIHTVEQLADMSDHAHEAIRAPSREWQAKAKAFLDQAKNGRDAQIAADNEKLKETVEQLQKQVTALLRGQNSIGFDTPKRGKKGRVSQDEGDVSLSDEGDIELEDNRL
jgi:uncharacterized protein with von Willebrand factor type A (vWA) domain